MIISNYYDNLDNFRFDVILSCFFQIKRNEH